MTVEVNCIQAGAQAILIVVAMGVILALRRSLPWWIVVCFELLLVSILARRVDDFSNWLLGVDLISNTVNLAISWVTIGIIVWSFAQAYRRRREVLRMESQWNERVEELEELRRGSEQRGGGWDHQWGLAGHTRSMTGKGSHKGTM
jgi:predicted membrane protein